MFDESPISLPPGCRQRVLEGSEIPESPAIGVLRQLLIARRLSAKLGAPAPHSIQVGASSIHPSIVRRNSAERRENQACASRTNSRFCPRSVNRSFCPRRASTNGKAERGAPMSTWSAIRGSVLSWRGALGALCLVIASLVLLGQNVALGEERKGDPLAETGSAERGHPQTKDRDAPLIERVVVQNLPPNANSDSAAFNRFTLVASQDTAINPVPSLEVDRSDTAWEYYGCTQLVQVLLRRSRQNTRIDREAKYLDPGPCSDVVAGGLSGIGHDESSVRFAVIEKIDRTALDSYVGAQLAPLRVASNPRLPENGSQEHGRAENRGDDEPFRELGELPLYFYVLAGLLAGGLIWGGAWLSFEGWLGDGTRLHRFAGGGLIVLGGCFWLCTGFAAIGEGPLAWQGGVLDAFVRFVQVGADLREPIAESEPSHLSHLRQLEVGDSGVKDDSHQRESLNDKLRVFAVALFSLAGFIAIYYGGWNLKFTDHAPRGTISLLVGIVLVAYGVTLFLQRFPGPRLSGHGAAAGYLGRTAAAEDRGIRRVPASAQGVCVSESRKQMKRQATAELPPPGCGEFAKQDMVQGEFIRVRQSGSDCSDYAQFGCGAVWGLRVKVRWPPDEFVQCDNLNCGKFPVISYCDRNSPIPLRIIGALYQHPRPERQFVRPAGFFELGGGSLSGVGKGGRGDGGARLHLFHARRHLVYLSPQRTPLRQADPDEQAGKQGDWIDQAVQKFPPPILGLGFLALGILTTWSGVALLDSGGGLRRKLGGSALSILGVGLNVLGLALVGVH
jgi:hypothetical protein